MNQIELWHQLISLEGPIYPELSGFKAQAEGGLLRGLVLTEFRRLTGSTTVRSLSQVAYEIKIMWRL